jgi:glycosyltransferase involved in cell wall biosynthesis/phospholipid N-methyltransferase
VAASRGSKTAIVAAQLPEKTPRRPRPNLEGGVVQDPPIMLSLSVLVPVYNEQHHVEASLDRLHLLGKGSALSEVQVIVVDDHSTDRTAEVLAAYGERVRTCAVPRMKWEFLRHERNRGKGAAVRTALARATGEITVIHDADLEYHPKDLLRMVGVFEAEHADAVFGSRFAGGETRRVLLFRHELGNRLLTFCTNLATNANFTDMETGYKAVRTDLLKSIPIVSNDFRFEPEIAIKLAKREARIFEIPISYSGRTYREGKKINWRDGVRAFGAIARFWFSDEIYAEDEHGSQILGRLARAPRFNAWMADTIEPYCGQRILEVGSGTGNLTRQLLPREHYVASDINPLYLHTLRGMLPQRPYLRVAHTDVTKGETFPDVEGGFDTIICLNVIEHVADDVEALRNIRGALAADGRAIVLVPQGPALMGTLDEVLGHERRYTPETLTALARRAGFRVTELLSFNRVGTPAWWLNGKVLKRREFGLAQIMTLNLLTPVFRRIDSRLPFPALSLIAILALEEGVAGRSRVAAEA